MPGPLSDTTTLAPQGVVSVRSVTVEPGGVWRTALSTSTRSTCSTRPSSPHAGAGAPLSTTMKEPRRAARACISRAQSAASSPSSIVVARDGDAARVEAREVEQVGRELRQPLHLLAHRVEELAALLLGQPALGEQLEVAAERRQRRAQLVRGVRDERRPRALERLEAHAHLVERARELADLVLLAVDDRLAEGAVRDAVGGRAQARETPGERLRGQRAGEQRDREGECAADHEPALDGARPARWTSRSGASTSTTPSAPWLRHGERRARRVRPLGETRDGRSWSLAQVRGLLDELDRTARAARRPDESATVPQIEAVDARRR